MKTPILTQILNILGIVIICAGVGGALLAAPRTGLVFALAYGSLVSIQGILLIGIGQVVTYLAASAYYAEKICDTVNMLPLEIRKLQK